MGNETQIRLTNGNETFMCNVIDFDNKGAIRAMAIDGSHYTRCEVGCEHHESVPADAQVWHDDEHTEDLWSSK